MFFKLNGKNEKELKQKYYYQKAKSDMEFFIYGAALLIQYKIFAASGAAAGLAAGVTVKGGGAAIAISVTGGGTVVVGAATATTAVTALTASGLLLLIGKDIGKVANRALEKGKEDIPKGNGNASDSLWKVAEKEKDLWNKGKLKEHFDKHGAEFGAKSSKEYSNMAYEFGTRKSNDIIQVINEAFVYRYEAATNNIFVGTIKGGKIKSFYKWDGHPDDVVIETLKRLGKIK